MAGEAADCFEQLLAALDALGRGSVFIRQLARVLERIEIRGDMAAVVLPRDHEWHGRGGPEMAGILEVLVNPLRLDARADRGKVRTAVRGERRGGRGMTRRAVEVLGKLAAALDGSLERDFRRC